MSLSVYFRRSGVIGLGVSIPSNAHELLLGARVAVDGNLTPNGQLLGSQFPSGEDYGRCKGGLRVVFHTLQCVVGYT
jgi:hypothetical protein